MENHNAAAWSHESISHYYSQNRLSTKDVYPSEWIFLKEKLRNGSHILDIGCAKGFMANVLSENLQHFNYTGIDISQTMIDAAQKKFPNLRFLKVNETDYSVLNNEQFDLVVCIGVLSIHEAWRQTLANAWSHTKETLIIDLRETYLPSIENKKLAYFKMGDCTVPYNVINAAEAQQAILDICTDANKITHYGYVHPISELAVCPIKKVMANVYCIERASQ